MKPQNIKYWLWAAFMTLPALCLQAQEMEYDTYVSKDSIDVPTHLFPSLYRTPSADRFDSTRWFNNTSLLFDWSPQMTFNSRTSHERLNGFGFTLMKEYNPNHALLLRGSFDRRKEYVGLGVGYMLNLTNYYWGYNRGRRNTWSFSTGLEAGIQDKKNNYMGGYVGLHFDHALTPYSSLFFEPRWGVYGQYFDPTLAPEDHDDPIISAISAQLGYRFRLSEHATRMPELSSIGNQHDYNWFIEMGGLLHEVHSFYNVTREREGDFVDINGNIVHGGGTESVKQDTIMYGAGFSMGLGFRGNSQSAALARVDLSNVNDNVHLTTAIDYLFSFTNSWLGENEHRHTDLDFLIGPVVMFNGIGKSETQFSLGMEWGARLARHISPEWELYAEPRWNFMKCYADNVDDLHYINFIPSIGFAYTYQHRGYTPSTHQQPMQGWYVQTLLGMQMATFDSKGGSHQLGSMAFSIGRDLTPLWGGRLSFFSGSMKSDEMDPVKDSYTAIEYPMFYNYFGVRAEAVMHFMRMWSTQLENSRWNWSFSGGFEFGQVSNRHRNELGFTAASQLQYRMTSHTWLTAEGRYHALSRSEAVMPMEGLLGLQYDFNMPRTFDFDRIPFHLYVMGGGAYRNGFFNSDEIGYNGAIGMDFNRKHGIRFDIISTQDSRNLVGIDYVYNWTDALMGESAKRRADMSLLGGVQMDLESDSKGKESMGMTLGMEVDYHFNHHLSLYLQPRITYMPWDENCQAIVNERLSMYSLLGLRVDFGK